MHPRIQPVVAELREQLEALYGPRLVTLVLYGSQARDDALPESDVDVLVVLRGTVDPCEEIARYGEMASDLCLRRGLVVSCVFISEDDFNRRQGPFLRNIRREGIPV